MRHVLDSLVETLKNNESVVLAAIIRNSGSAPRTSGARMLVKSDQTLIGSVGGGALEGSCQARALKMFDEADSFAELNFQLNAASAADAGMVCGGDVSVLLMKIEPDSLDLFSQLQEAYHRNERSFLVTVLPHGTNPPRLLFCGAQNDSSFPSELHDELMRKSRREPFLMTIQQEELFIEPLLHPGTVHLVGAGHVALATAECAFFAGFEVVVMDDRADFANAERYPQARDIRVLPSFHECLGDLGPEDYVVIVTRGHLHDREVLAQALRTDAGYIGMIGSRKKRDSVYKSLLEEGFTEKDLQRVNNPIGLAIGADTPAEIAVSIVAELIQSRAGIKG
jgi:xanthine dehydrogenase accessory factor